MCADFADDRSAVCEVQELPDVHAVLSEICHLKVCREGFREPGNHVIVEALSV